jgi:ankyrin repeat protein
MKKLYFIIFAPFFLFAMQQSNQTPESYFDLMPWELYAEIFKFFDADGENYEHLLEKYKKFYTANPRAQKHLGLSKALINYTLQKYRLPYHVLEWHVDHLKEFPIFTNPAFKVFINKESCRLHLESDLRDACNQANLQWVNLSLRDPINVNARSIGNYSPLLCISDSRHAKESDRFAIAQALINKGALVNDQDPAGCTPLHWAVCHRNQALIELLVSHGAIIDPCESKDGNTPLMYAVNMNSANIVQILLQAQANANHINKHRVTPLIAAIRNIFADQYTADRATIVRLLLQAGADPNRYPMHTEKNSILKFVREKINNADLEKLLIQYGAYDKTFDPLDA